MKKIDSFLVSSVLVFVIFVAIGLTSCKPIVRAGDKICIDEEYSELKTKVCVSRSLAEQHLPLHSIQKLVADKKKKKAKEISSSGHQNCYIDNALSLKWNRAVKNVAKFSAPVESLDFLIKKLDASSNLLSEIKKGDAGFYNFLLQNLREFIKSSPQPVYRQKRGQITLDNDPVFDFFPFFLEKLVDYLKQTGKFDGINEEEIRKRIDKEVMGDFIPHYTSISKHWYPIQYYFLIIKLATKELHELYDSINKTAYIVRHPSFKGAKSDYVGNFFISESFIRNIDDDALETVMAHESMHLLRDNSNRIIMHLFKKYCLNGLRKNMASLIEQFDERTLDSNDIEEIESNLKLYENLLNSLDYEISIDNEVLRYFSDQPFKRKKYADIIASFENVPSERLAIIDTLNECIDEKEKDNFQLILGMSMEGGALIDNSETTTISKCYIKLKVALREYLNYEVRRRTKNDEKKFLEKNGCTKNDSEKYWEEIYNSFQTR